MGEQFEPNASQMMKYSKSPANVVTPSSKFQNQRSSAFNLQKERFLNQIPKDGKSPQVIKFDEQKPEEKSRVQSRTNELTGDPKKSLSFTDIEETFDKIR